MYVCVNEKQINVKITIYVILENPLQNLGLEKMNSIHNH